MEKRRFKIIGVEVHNFSTDFIISDLGHSNKKNAMSPEAFIHCIGTLFGKHLEEIKDLEFEIIVPGGAEDETLNLCGEKLNGK